MHAYPLTNVMSLEAAAALMCRLGWRIELLQSNARANVPTALKHNISTLMNAIQPTYSFANGEYE